MSHSSRRQFLQHTALGAGLLATSPLWASDAGDWSQTSFRPLPIPELISGEAQADGFHYYLRARHGETEFYPGQPTATMGLNGSYLGPTLQVRQHEQVHIHVQNDLSEATTNNSVTGKLRSANTFSITSPTIPVAPTTATFIMMNLKFQLANVLIIGY